MGLPAESTNLAAAREDCQQQGAAQSEQRELQQEEARSEPQREEKQGGKQEQKQEEKQEHKQHEHAQEQQLSQTQQRRQVSLSDEQRQRQVELLQSLNHGELLGAPLRLQTESYEAFAKRLNLFSSKQPELSMEDELRRLDIDPAVFYGNAKPLGLREYVAEDLTAVPPGDRRPPEPNSGTASAAGAAGLFQPPERTACVGDTAPSQTGGKPRTEEAEPTRRCPALNVPNVPQLAELEDMPYEEICLNSGSANETTGGRLGHETPREMEAKLQIDTLTDDEDDGDDPVFKSTKKTVQADEEDEITTFALDPEFDYDNVANLTSRC
eukprot:TRINITY_DN49853_c0_g1_i1.p1 TRINITY_DN49853_c0_g1~~TRINITY_DN49853_c0_g1_i1.p1  ORF type:complete len:325 (+),score=90.54 TRINITY_DN49853_c0_g1_i1:92-1066(+)